MVNFDRTEPRACFCVGPPGNCPCIRRMQNQIPNEPAKYEWPDFTKIPPIPASQTGWLCPRCGRGNAPTCQTCICQPLPAPVIT